MQRKFSIIEKSHHFNWMKVIFEVGLNILITLKNLREKEIVECINYLSLAANQNFSKVIYFIGVI